jgi:hypothetical protein
MGPLAFVNWRVFNHGFCALMWAVAIALCLAILVHLGGPVGGSLHHGIWHGSLLTAPAGAGVR